MKFKFPYILFLILLFVTMCIRDTTVQVKSENNISSAREALETARYYMKLSKFSKAIIFYNIVLTKYKDQKEEASWALYEKAHCYYKLKKYTIALQTFKRVGLVYPEEYGPAKLAQKMIEKIEFSK